MPMSPIIVHYCFNNVGWVGRGRIHKSSPIHNTMSIGMLGHLVYCYTGSFEVPAMHMITEKSRLISMISPVFPLIIIHRNQPQVTDTRIATWHISVTVCAVGVGGTSGLDGRRGRGSDLKTKGIDVAKGNSACPCPNPHKLTLLVITIPS